MPSGKKARGRKNRAKKEATRTADLRSQWEPTILASDNRLDVLPSCEHNHELSGLQIPQEGTVVSFMNHIASEGYFTKTALFPDAAAMEICFNSLSLCFPGVQEEDNERALAIALLLRFLCNVLHDPLARAIWSVHRRECGDVEGYQDGQQVGVRESPGRREVCGQAHPLYLSEGAAPRCEDEGRESGQVHPLSKAISQIRVVRLHGMHDG
ncbi:hypothetical protein THAOC_13001 [Thalassiosira oceanica]|uniref:Uncharacterized protein n=1 Tax=Thalassiosira oceanica TaxID=159749 RepID=K0T6N2_THAOC|nr:hypothetical protein THAOC_13001 [Thalassiosira oceanica]|eukprot:EJK66097.1 hypothetical protein THAOC_13001 [Thalassiosira oceanica]